MDEQQQPYAIDDPKSLDDIAGTAIVSKQKLCDELATWLMTLPGNLVANIANDILLTATGEQSVSVQYRGDKEFIVTAD